MIKERQFLLEFERELIQTEKTDYFKSLRLFEEMWNKGVFLKVIEDLGLKVIPDDPEDFVNKTFVLPAQDMITGIRVDLIFSFTPYEKKAIERAKPVYFDDTAVMQKSFTKSGNN